MSYADTLKWFTTNFGGGGLPDMLDGLPCAFPSCKAPDAGLVSFTPCPAVQDCLALVKNVSATNNSKVKVNLSNACNIKQSSSASSNATPAAGPTPSPETLTSQKLTYMAIIIVVTVVLALAFAAGGTLGKAAIVRARNARA
jgi:hypothetical protein